MTQLKKVILCGVPGMKYSDIMKMEEYIREEYPQVNFEFLGEDVLDKEDALKKLKDAQVLVSWDQEMDEELYEKLDLQAYVAASTGYNAANVDAATKKNVIVCNIKDYCRDEVATHTVMFILACARKLHTAYSEVKDGIWSQDNLTGIRRFSQSTVGILGLGSIGSSVAEKLAGFNCRIISYDPYISEERMSSLGVEKVDLETLLKESDYLSIHSPLLGDTKNMFDMDAFKLMKKTAYIINTSRGKNIKQDDLYEALTTGMIAGAALDVLENEPPMESDKKLIALENVMVTPHSAYLSEESSEAQIRITAEEVGRILREEIPLNIVNREILDR